MASRTLVKRVSSIPSANAVSLDLQNWGGSAKGFFVKNLSPSGVIMYIADQTTAGAAPTTSTDIPADCTNYYTINSGDEQFVSSTTPEDLFVQVSSGSAGIAQIVSI